MATVVLMNILRTLAILVLLTMTSTSAHAEDESAPESDSESESKPESASEANADQSGAEQEASTAEQEATTMDQPQDDHPCTFPLATVVYQTQEVIQCLVSGARICFVDQLLDEICVPSGYCVDFDEVTHDIDLVPPSVTAKPQPTVSWAVLAVGLDEDSGRVGFGLLQISAGWGADSYCSDGDGTTLF